MNRTPAPSVKSQPPSPLVDQFGRRHTSLRLSVTDRCNIRCFYCMPERGATFVPRQTLLSFEEMTQLVEILVRHCGIDDLRLTGGEPLVRRELPTLVRMLSKIEGLGDLSMTTNGMLLAESAASLRDAGLKRVNISLDTLDRDKFVRIARRDGLQATLRGIEAAIDCGFESVKINSLAIAGTTEDEVLSLVEFAIGKGITIRFIEFMPLDADRNWAAAAVLSGDRIIEMLNSHFGGCEPIGRISEAQPAELFAVGNGRVGIIRSVTRPFCESCNRIRVTADGAVRNCLFSTNETGLRDLIRGGGSESEIVSRVADCVLGKRKAHGMGLPGQIADVQAADSFAQSDRPMYSIGG